MVVVVVVVGASAGVADGGNGGEFSEMNKNTAIVVTVI